MSKKSKSKKPVSFTQKQNILKARQADVNRRYRQFGGRKWKYEEYFGATTRGYVPRDPARSVRGKLRQRQVATREHYKDYLSLASFQGVAPAHGKPAMGKLGPDLIFTVTMHPAAIASFLVSNQQIYIDIIREFRATYRRIVTFIQTDLVGDPRTFGKHSKGLVPRGGTGYMRLFTRAALEKQLSFNTNFPFRLTFEVPVDYANPTNEKRTARLAHFGTKEYRIVDYTGITGYSLKPKWKKVELYDPKARGNFFEECIEQGQDYAAFEFRRLFKRLDAKYSKKINFKTIMGGVINFNAPKSVFIFDPPDFSSLF